ncbi:hypothetical protein [Rhodanobacter sp. C01]|uniref:hypothetical protein n=1 Tax=Rhodanobacter sp. C01 TaxID=1945856 RepID=UPI000984C07C|nr:hypothetical protein [Rhodanobacter sp. C01]
MPLKNPVIFTILVIIVLLCAAIATYLYGLPLLQGAQMGCGFGGGTKTLGCSTSFGLFMTWVTFVVGVAIFAIWSKFGRQ